MAKYLKINGKVSKDKWQSMFRYLARYVKTKAIIKNGGLTRGKTLQAAGNDYL